jgi:hypothetical protein
MIMSILLTIIAAFYLLMMRTLLTKWIAAYQRGSRLSQSEKQSSYAVIAFATLLWPIVLPFAYLELLDNSQKTAQKAKLAETKLGLNWAINFSREKFSPSSNQRHWVN